MTEVRSQLIERLCISPDDRQELVFWEEFLHRDIHKLVESHAATIIYSHTKIPTTASCMSNDKGERMQYIVAVVDKQGHPYCLECGERDNRIYTPDQLISMFPEQAHFIIPFFHDHEAIVDLRQSLDG